MTDKQAPSLAVSSCLDSCVPYLSVFSDLFQFYLLSLLVMKLHKHARRTSYAVLVFIIFGATAVTFTISVT